MPTRRITVYSRSYPAYSPMLMTFEDINHMAVPAAAMWKLITPW